MSGRPAEAGEVQKESVAAGAFRGLIRSIFFIKMKSVLKAASLKCFRPGKKSMFVELKASANRGKVTLSERAKQILRSEGYTGLGRRVFPPMLTNLFTGGVLFGTYSVLYSHSTFKGHDRESRDSIVFVEAGMAGFAAGCAHALVSMPCELWENAVFRNVSMRDLIPRSQRRVSLVDLMEYSFKRYSLHHHIFKDATAFGIFFGTFEACKHHWKQPISDAVQRAGLPYSDFLGMGSTAVLAGATAGVGYTSISFPMQWIAHQRNKVPRLSLLSTQFASSFMKATVRTSIPNAAAFLLLEILAYNLDD